MLNLWACHVNEVARTMIEAQKGRTTTDLPLRQTYYRPNNDGSPVTEGRAMLLASYDDGLNIGYWDGFHDKRGIWWHDELQHIAPLKWFAGSALAQADGHSAWNAYAAPDVMVKEVQRQLTVIHGLAFIPDVQDAAYKDWAMSRLAADGTIGISG